MNRNAESIFHAAKHRSANERDVFLDGACGNDVGLRAKVDALLRADAEAGSFLASVEPDPDATMPKTGRGDRAGQPQSAPAEQAGQMIGRDGKGVRKTSSYFAGVPGEEIESYLPPGLWSSMRIAYRSCSGCPKPFLTPFLTF